MFNRSLIQIFTIATLVAGCAANTTSPVVKPDAATTLQISGNERELGKAENLEKRGEYVEAALLYIKLANASASPRRENLRLRAVAALLSAGLFTQAKLILKDIPYEDLDETQAFHYALLSTRAAIAERRPDEAAEWLARLKAPANAPPALLHALQDLRINVLELSGKTLEAVKERIALEPLLQDNDAARHENELSVMRLLSLLSEQALQEMITQPAPDVMSGWLELALLNKRYPDPLRLAQQLENWRGRYPTHPATRDLIASMIPQQKSGVLRLDHIALILPLQGPFAKAAGAVRDGFLAAYYGQNLGDTKPTIRLYDSNDRGGDIQAIYRQAVDDGATVVVGPLNKDSVAALARGGHLNVPTLALNYLEDEPAYTENLYQFGLLPEDEARQTADRAWLDGHSRAAVLFPTGAWGERVKKAFGERWEQLGGKVITTQAYDPNKTDFSAPLMDLLNIRDSNTRYRELTKLVGKSMNFEPHRRQDIDFIFMAAFPRQARLIPPQLKFHHAAGLPVYTTSHAFSGKVDRASDRDMNGVIIGDMPWVLTKESIHAVRKDVFRVWPEAAGSQLSRLYALGADAYNVLYYVNWLRANPQARLRGVTGVLYMDASNQIHRQLTWAQFRAGAPQPFAVSPVLPSR